MVMLAALATIAACSGEKPRTLAATDGSTTTTAEVPTTTTEAPTTTTQPPPPASATWDEIKNTSIPSMCGHPPTTLVNGEDVTLGEYDGYFRLTPLLANGQPGLVADVPGPAGPLTAVVVSCNGGGVGWPAQIAFFAPGGAFHGSTDLAEITDWGSSSLEFAGRDGVEGLSVVDGNLQVVTSAGGGDDPLCCPSGRGVVTISTGGGAISVLSAATVSGAPAAPTPAVEDPKPADCPTAAEMTAWAPQDRLYGGHVESVDQCEQGWAFGSIVSGGDGTGSIAFRYRSGRWEFVYAAASWSSFCEVIASQGFDLGSDCP